MPAGPVGESSIKRSVLDLLDDVSDSDHSYLVEALLELEQEIEQGLEGFNFQVEESEDLDTQEDQHEMVNVIIRYDDVSGYTINRPEYIGNIIADAINMHSEESLVIGAYLAHNYGIELPMEMIDSIINISEDATRALFNGEL